MRAVEDAIARQVFHGGDLATNLLELGGVREDVLLPLLAESHGIEAAPAGRLPAPPPEVLRVVPGDLALRHGLYPLAMKDDVLTVAVAEPLPPAVEDDLVFALGVAIRPVVAPLVRIRQAIAESYGIPLDRRFVRLQARLEGRGDPSPSAAPPPGADLVPQRMPRPISIPAPTFGTGVPSSDRRAARLEAKPAPKAPFVARAEDLRNPAIPKSPGLPEVPLEDASTSPTPPSGPVATSEAPRSSPEVTNGAAAAVAHAPTLPASGQAERAAPPREEQGASDGAGLPASAPVPLVRAANGTPAPAPVAGTLPGPPPPERFVVESSRTPVTLGETPKPPAQPVATRAIAGVLRDALREERAADKSKPRVDGAARWRPVERRRKGPFTSARAEEELDQATSSDEVLAILFAFAQQFFEYTALFVVHGDLAEGRDASGPGADRAKVLGVGVALDLPSSLATARARRGPVIAAPAAEGLDADLLRDLGRERDKRRAAAFLPVAVRARTVAILFGDDGDADVELASIGDVISVIGLTGAALERIALRKKLGGREPEVRPPARPARPVATEGARKARAQEGAAALARALTAGKSAAAPAAPEPEPEPEPAAAEAPVSSEPDVTSVEPVDATPTPLLASPRDSWIPVVAVEGAPADETPPAPSAEESPAPPASDERPQRRSTPHSPTRRGLAPVYEGRGSVVRDGAQVEWLGGTSSEAPTMGLAPLPLTPPPNAVSAPRQTPVDRRPLPREEGPDSNPDPGALATASTVPFPTRTSHPPRYEPALPSVVVDVAAEHRELIQRAVDGGPRGQEAFDELVRNGEHTIQAVMARFPGPLRVDRHRARGELPAASQCGPILELVVAIRRPALPFVSVRSSSTDPEMRFWATHTLGELRYPEAATVLVPRLFDDDAQVRRIARRSAAALVGAGPAGAPILKGLEDITRNPDQPKLHRMVAIETMGEIRSGSLVPPLLEALEDPSEDVADSARKALLVIARQDFGRDGRRWSDWWAKNATRHRIEWLIDALMHDQPSVRRAAGDELKLLTKEYFGYYDDLPKRDRERAQGLYRSWWEREGKRRFA